MRSLLQQMMEALRSGKEVKAYMHEGKLFTIEEWVAYVAGNCRDEVSGCRQLESLCESGECTFEQIDQICSDHIQTQHHMERVPNCTTYDLQLEWRKRHPEIVPININWNGNINWNAPEHVLPEYVLPATDYVQPMTADEINRLYTEMIGKGADDDGRTAQGTASKAEADSPAKDAARQVGKRKSPGTT